MSYAESHTSSRAQAVTRMPSPPPRIATRPVFDHRSAPHGYHSAASFAKGPREIIANASPNTVTTSAHRDISTRFGQRLRQLRTQRNLTQVRMAREFGVDRSYISDVERGRKSISLPTMEIFALGLKLSLAELLAGV